VTSLRFAGRTPGFAVEHLRLTGVDRGWPDALDTNDTIWRFFAAHYYAPRTTHKPT
jgi:hypothetical protein